jgi:hypothetical protein
VGTIVVLARHTHALALRDQPTFDQHIFSWVIVHFIYFYAPTVTGMYPSNYFMDGSATNRILPIFSVFVTAFRAIVQCGELQTLIPAMPEECTSPMCTLLFSCMFF